MSIFLKNALIRHFDFSTFYYWKRSEKNYDKPIIIFKKLIGTHNANKNMAKLVEWIMYIAHNKPEHVLEFRPAIHLKQRRLHIVIISIKTR